MAPRETTDIEERSRRFRQNRATVGFSLLSEYRKWLEMKK